METGGHTAACRTFVECRWEMLPGLMPRRDDIGASSARRCDCVANPDPALAQRRPRRTTPPHEAWHESVVRRKYSTSVHTYRIPGLEGADGSESRIDRRADGEVLAGRGTGKPWRNMPVESSLDDRMPFELSGIALP